MLAFSGTDKKVEWNGDVLKKITAKNFNIHTTKLSDKDNVWLCKGEELWWKNFGNTTTKKKTLVKLPKSPVFLAGILENISFPEQKKQKQVFLSSNPFQFCDRVVFLLQEKEARNSFDMINKEFVALKYKLLDYERMYLNSISFSNIPLKTKWEMWSRPENPEN